MDRETLEGWPSGSTREWRRLRADFIARNPTCALCPAPTEEVDHRVPLADGGSLLDPSNWQALCGHHHAQKTARENTHRRGQRQRPRVRVDPTTGYPLAGEGHRWTE